MNLLKTIAFCLVVFVGLVPIANGLAQAGDPLGLGVTVRIAALNRLNQLIDNVFGRLLIRITHSKIDNILTACTRLALQLIGNAEDVRW